MIATAHGVRWLDRALEAATRHEVAEAVGALAADYLANRGSFAVAPDPAGDDRVRVIRGRIGAVLSHEGIVLGWIKQTGDEETGNLGIDGPARRRRKASKRGPNDLGELDRWLAGTGIGLRPTSGGHYQAVRSADGAVLATFSGTASDHRSFANSLADLRRASGLELRQ